MTQLITDFYLDNGIFSKGRNGSKTEVILYAANYIFYNVIFFSSFFLFLFKKEKMEKYYFVIPIIVYLFILSVFILYTDFSLIIGVSLFLSFFPLYFLSYYLKFVKKII